MNTSSKIAALAPVSVAAVGLTQLHWMVSHFATIAELTAAVTVGTALWIRNSKGGQDEEQRGSQPQERTYQALPPSKPVVVDYNVLRHGVRQAD